MLLKVKYGTKPRLFARKYTFFGKQRICSIVSLPSGTGYPLVRRSSHERGSQCQCEHICHMDHERRSPNGNPGHRYGTEFYNPVTVKTAYGPFSVCLDCKADCMKEQIVNGNARLLG